MNKSSRQRLRFGGKIVMGLCHVIWATQREILQEEYGIEWFTPAEMNPNVCFG